MTQKTTLPGTFTGPLVSSLPTFIHSAPVTSGLVRRYVGLSLDSALVGSAVGTLTDMTGLGASLTQSDPALKPTARQSGRIRYLEFTADSLVGAGISGSPATFAVVGRFRTASNAGNWPIAQLGAGAGAYSRGSTGLLASYGNATLTGGGDPGTAWHVFLATFAGVDSVVRVDTTEVLGNAGTVSSGNNVQLGTLTSGVPGPEVDVAEMLIWNRVMTLAERQKIVADLKLAYGI